MASDTQGKFFRNLWGESKGSDAQGKIFLFLERLWLVSTVLAVCLVTYFLIIKDNDSAVFFIGFFILSGLLYLMRKRQRLRYQKQNASGPNYEPGKKS